MCLVWQGKWCKSSPTQGFRILNCCSFVHGIRMFRCVVHVLAIAAPDATIYNATATGLKGKRYSLIVMLILSKLCNIFVVRCDWFVISPYVIVEIFSRQVIWKREMLKAISFWMILTTDYERNTCGQKESFFLTFF